MILGLALEKITKLPLRVALSRQVLRPLGLHGTVASRTRAAIPSPALHAFSPERKSFLGSAGNTIDEESTFWNPSWTLARGSVETTDIKDMTRTAIGIGSGRLLTRPPTVSRSTTSGLWASTIRLRGLQDADAGLWLRHRRRPQRLVDPPEPDVPRLRGNRVIPAFEADLNRARRDVQAE